MALGHEETCFRLTSCASMSWMPGFFHRTHGWKMQKIVPAESSHKIWAKLSAPTEKGVENVASRAWVLGQHVVVSRKNIWWHRAFHIQWMLMVSPSHCFIHLLGRKTKKHGQCLAPIVRASRTWNSQDKDSLSHHCWSSWVAGNKAILAA